MPEESSDPAGRPPAPDPAASTTPPPSQPTPDSTAQPAREPTAQPAPDSTAEPTEQPTTEPTEQPTTDPAADARPRAGLRIGPWLAPGPESSDRPGAHSVADEPTGPSWTAPTVELRATGPRGRRRTGSTYASTRSAATTTRPARSARRYRSGRLRDYGWLFAAAAIAAVVLAFGPRLFTAPEPDWDARAARPSASPTETAPPSTPTPAPTSAAPIPTAKPSPTPSTRRSTRAPRPRSTPRPRTSRPAAAPVLLGPANGGELWGMLRRYCFEVHQTPEAQLRTGVTPAENNWECRSFRPIPIDMNAACRHTYGSAAFARFSDRNNAFSWQCFRNA